MAKCIFCGNEFQKHSENEVKEIGTKLSNSKYNLLSIFYQHVFSYCPNCKMVELNFDENEIKFLQNKKQKILDVINNKELEKIDENFFIRQAETKGYVCELLNDNIGAFLGYKACAELLGIYIDEYIENMTNNVLHKDGKSFRIINRTNLSQFDYAVKHKEIMEKLVIGKYNESIINDLGYLGILIYLDSILEIAKNMADKDDKGIENVIKIATKIINTLKDSKIDERFEPVLEREENQLLLINKILVKN